MHNDISVKEREKAGVVRPKAEGKREVIYRVTELNRPNPSLLLGLIGVIEKEYVRPNSKRDPMSGRKREQEIPAEPETA